MDLCRTRMMQTPKKMAKENVHSHFRTLSTVRRYPSTWVGYHKPFPDGRVSAMRVGNPGQLAAVD